MNNRLLLKQAREGINRLINENSEIIIIYRKPLIDDGFGGLVEDPHGDPVPHEIKCRIFHESKMPGNFFPAPSGLSTNLSRAILVEHDVIIFDGDLFEAIEKRFKIGAVDPLIKFEGVTGYQAPLTEAVAVITES